MENLAFQMMRKHMDYMRSGVLHAFGATPAARVGDTLEMNFLGKRILLNKNEMRPRIAPGGTDPTWGDYLGVGAGTLMTAASIGMGFSQGGILGGLRAGVWDIGVDAAMVRHGYRSAADAGVRTFEHGRLPPWVAGGLNRLGAPGRFASKAAGLADFSHRYIWGSLLAYGVGNALGGGVVGTAGALVGGSLGVRHAGKLTAVAGAYYLGKAVSMGTYSVMKAGYNHFQAQKAINTDGDMAAFMTQGAFSNRARAVAAIQKSHMNARSALGREASYMHYPQRSYSSPYRQGY